MSDALDSWREVPPLTERHKPFILGDFLGNGIEEHLNITVSTYGLLFMPMNNPNMTMKFKNQILLLNWF